MREPGQRWMYSNCKWINILKEELEAFTDGVDGKYKGKREAKNITRLWFDYGVIDGAIPPPLPRYWKD